MTPGSAFPSFKKRLVTHQCLCLTPSILLANRVGELLYLPSTSQHYSNTRSANSLDFRLPSIKLCQDQTFYFNAIKDWNNLPTTIKQIRNKTSFKQSVKKHLMEDLKLCEESSFVYFLFFI